MAVTAAVTDFHNAPNYVGRIFQVSAELGLAFLKDIGGNIVYQNGQIITDRFMSINQFDFALCSPWSLDAGSQPDIDETDARTAPTGDTYARGQDNQTNQIFQEAIDISYKALSTTAQLKQAAIGASIASLAVQGQVNEEQDKLAFQIDAHVKQVAADANYTFLNGTYQVAQNNTTSAMTRGIITGTSTNAVAASSASLSTALIDSMVLAAKQSGAPMIDPCIYTAAFHVQQLNKLYASQVQHNTQGGTAINQILLPLIDKYVPVKFDYHVPAGTLILVDRAVVRPVGCPVPGKGYLFYEDLGKAGAVEYGMVYGQLGIDYGPEEYHAKITGLATS